MRLVDLQARPGRSELLKPILCRALQRCHDEGIYILEAVGFCSEKQRIIESLNPHQRELASWRYFYRANNERLAARLRNPELWDPSCFDGDSSL